MTGPGRPGLLAALTTAISGAGLEMEQVDARPASVEGWVVDTFHVTLTGSGGKLADATQQARVVQALEGVLFGGSSGGGGGGGQVPGACREDLDCSAPGARSAVGQQRVPEMLSGAGHDAMAMAEVTRIGMVFVRSLNGGVSHSPDELTAAEDVAAAAAALATFLEAEVLGGYEGADEGDGASGGGEAAPAPAARSNDGAEPVAPAAEEAEEAAAVRDEL